MNYTFFNGEINNASVEKLIDKISLIKDDCIVYFSSYGGESEATGYFIDFTNRFSHEITLICNHNLYSNGFDMFMLSNTKKITMDDCLGMIHIEGIEVNSREMLSEEDENINVFETISIGNERRKESYKKLGVSAKCLSSYSKGEDVFFNNTDMKKFAEKAIKLFNKKVTIVI